MFFISNSNNSCVYVYKDYKNMTAKALWLFIKIKLKNSKNKQQIVI